MTMLPDVDQQAWTDYEREQFQRQLNQRNDAFGFMQGVQDRVAGLQGIVGGFAGAAGEALGGAGEALGGAGEALGGAAGAAGGAAGQAVGQFAGDRQAQIEQAMANAQARMAEPASAAAPPASAATPPAAPVTADISRPAIQDTAALDDRMAQIDARMAQLQPQLRPQVSTTAQPPEDDRMAQITSRLDALRGQVQPALESAVGGADDRMAQITAAMDRARAGLNLQPPTGAEPGSGGGPVNPNPSPAEVRSYIVQAAQQRGIDPDIALRVANSEGGFEAARRGTFKTGSSWWPFQLHYGGQGYEHLGNVAGMGNAFTQQTGFQPGDPNAWQAATDYALDRAKQGGWGAWYGAKAQGITGFQGIDRGAADVPFLHKAGEALQGATRPFVEGARAVGEGLAGTARDISQFGDPELTASEANAACGPAAAVRFAQRFGRNPTLREALDLARTVGWTAQQGMAGLGSQKALMDKLGIETQLVSGPQWDKFAAEAQTGNPVTISTSAHYFYADGYNPDTGAFHVGRSGTDLRGGKEWMTKDEIVAAAQRLGGGNVQGALLANNPTVPASSTAQPSSSSSIGSALAGATSFAQRGLEQLLKSSEEATQRGRAWADEQARNLDAAITATAADVTATNQPTPVDLRTPPRELSQTVRRQMAGEEDAQLGPLTIPGRVAGTLGALGEFSEEVSPLTHIGRLYEGYAGASRRDPERSAALNALFEAEARGDKAEALRQQAIIDSRSNAIREGMDLSPGAAYERGLASPDIENVEAIANLMGGVASVGAAPRGLASGGRQFLASLAIDPMSAPFGVLGEVAGPALQAISRWVPPAQRPQAVADVMQAVAEQAPAGALPARASAELAATLGGGAFGGYQGWQSGEDRPFEERIARTLGGTAAGLGGVYGGARALERLEQLPRFVKPSDIPPPPAPGSAGYEDYLLGRGKWAPPEVPPPPTKWDKAMALMYFNLLSLPITHIRNIVGGAVTTGLSPIESLGAAAWDPVARKAMEQVAKRYDPGAIKLPPPPRPGSAEYQDYLQGRGKWAPPEMDKVVRDVLKETQQRQRYFGEAAADGFGLAAGLPAGLKNAIGAYAAKTLEEGADRARTEVFTGLPGHIIHAAGRGLQAEDAFFSTAAEYQAAYRMAYRQARQEGIKGNGAELRDRITEIVTNPSEKLLKEAVRQGQYRTFKQPTKLAELVATGQEKIPALRVLLPFVKTPINLSKYMLERSPAGFAGIINDFRTAKGRERLLTKPGGASGDLADRLSRASMGSLIAAGIAAYGAGGESHRPRLTGRPPANEAERRAWERQGIMPYSLLGLDDRYYSYRALQPVAPVLGTVADIQQTLRDYPDEELGGLATILAASIGRGLVDTQWTQDLYDAMDIWMSPGDPSSKIERSVERYAGGRLVPSFLRGLARATDSTIPDPDNPLEAIAANIPGVEAGVERSLDAWGRPRKFMGPGGLESLLNPIPSSELTQDPLEIELARLQGRQYDVQPGSVSDRMTVLGQEIELDPDQQRKYQRLSGQLAYADLQMLIGSEEWRAMNDSEREKAVDGIIRDTRSFVREMMAETDVGLMRKAARESLKQARRDLGSPAYQQPVEVP